MKKIIKMTTLAVCIVVSITSLAIGVPAILTKTGLYCDGEILQYVNLVDQRLCDYCDDCYCFNATVRTCSPLNHCWKILEGEIFRQPTHEGSEIQLYFGGEFEIKPQLRNGDPLVVRWCRIPGAGYRVRGVMQ